MPLLSGSDIFPPEGLSLGDAIGDFKNPEAPYILDRFDPICPEEYL